MHSHYALLCAEHLTFFCSLVDQQPASQKTELEEKQRYDSARVATLIASMYPEVRQALTQRGAGVVAAPQPAVILDDTEDSAPTPDEHGFPAAEGADSAGESQDTEAQIRQNVVGCRVAKDFGKQNGGVYYGEIKHVVDDPEKNPLSLDDLFFSVEYEDDDTEDFNIVELYSTCSLSVCALFRQRFTADLHSNAILFLCRTLEILLQYHCQASEGKERQFAAANRSSATRCRHAIVSQCKGEARGATTHRVRQSSVVKQDGILGQAQASNSSG
jgi:hypothetical protein